MTGARPVADLQSNAPEPGLAIYVTLGPDGGPAARALLAQLARTLVGVVNQRAPGATARSTLTVGGRALGGDVALQSRPPALELAPWPVNKRLQSVPQRQLLVDPDAREVTLSGRVVPMTLKEFGLLEYLLRAPHRAVTRDELLTNVWHKRTLDNGTRTIDVHVRRLREKLGGCLRIVTIRGVGYRCDPTPEVVLVGSGDAD